MAVFAERVPQLVPAPWLHRAGLEALAAGNPVRADALFERAALGYRRALDLEPLARVRIHQRMAQVRGGVATAEDLADLERMLLKLESIESLDPPFDVVPAHAALLAWRRSLGGEAPSHPPRLRLVS